MKGQGMLRKMKRWKDRLREHHEHVKSIVNSKTDFGGGGKRRKETKPVSFSHLFRFATSTDKCLLLLATASCVCVASGFPFLNILAGNMATLMVQSVRGKSFCNDTTLEYRNYTEEDQEIFEEKLALYSLYLAITGVVQFIAGYLSISLFNRVSKHLTYRIRIRYVKALLMQDVGWFDTRKDICFITRIEEDVRKIEQAIGDKMALFFYYGLNSFLCFVIAMFYGWKLTLSIICPFPVMAIFVFFLEDIQSQLTVEEQMEYSKSGNVAEQALVNIKTVAAFCGMKKETKKYSDCLAHAELLSRKRGFVTALGVSSAWLCNFVSYALVIWYGTYLVISDWNNQCEEGQINYDIGTVIVIVFNVLDVEFNLAQTVILLEIISQGRGAASAIFSVIEKTAKIERFSVGMTPPQDVRGKIVFQNVSFSYPNRPNVQILDDMNLTIGQGMTVALVGESGCGKSTCLQLLQRFYDPQSGAIFVDDVDIRDYNIQWYRSQIAIVGQEPVLFNTTIAENVRYGRADVTQDEIEEACILANAHRFILKLPKKYETIVGDRGSQLSGGQKQRIAIARAFVQNPSILLLDEVTSALDNNNEYVIQRAIDKVREGRTTLIVTHNLRTVKTADLIVILKHGQVAQVGTPQQLTPQSFEQYTDGEEQELREISYGEEDEEGGNKEDPKDETEVEKKSIEDLLADLRQHHRARSEVSFQTPAPTPPDLELVQEKKLYRDKIRSLTSAKSVLKVFFLDKKVVPLMILGFVMSIAHGFVLPLTAALFDEGLQIFLSADLSEAYEEANHLILEFVILGSASAAVIFFGIFSFCVTGDKVTNQLRKSVFEAMMQQEMAWFQKPHNTVAALCSKLSGDAATIHEASGAQMETLVNSIMTIVIAVGTSFYLHLKLASVGLIFVPLILIASYFNGKLVENQESEEKVANEQASCTSYQAISNIRTVKSLGLEHFFARKYKEQLEASYRKTVSQAHLLGVVFGTSQGIMYFAYACVLYTGGYLVQTEKINYAIVFTIGELMVWTMLEMGQTLAYLPSYNKAKVAAGRMFLILNRESQMDEPTSGLQVDSIAAKVEFQNVSFAYGSRSNYKVLRDINWEALPNSRIAIIGPSGSGKSTIVDLILRFYDPTTGKLLVDDTDMRALNLESLRSQISIVSQEPGLFDISIAENIAYGDNSRDVPLEDIIDAAKNANIHDFIASLPEGYDTKVNDMQLSGGQKQRIAIARALVKNPRLLLLDEATSALDRENEEIILDTLESVESDRTCIKVAHHLSHIQGSSQILVINGGKIVEVGTHEKLLKLRGIYYTLWCIQQGVVTK